ncbi:MAG: MmgE/PrpD family protein [Gammaproteobacteria bacterium]
MTTNPLKAYGEWIASVDNTWPEEALDSAYRELIDTIAVIIPGAVSPVAEKVLGRARQWGPGDCTAAGSTDRLALPWAAMINATAGHALDFDDNFDPAKAHVSTVLWPAILAVAEQEGSSPRDCLDAYIVALQIQGRIGQGLNPPHRKRGWHSTATTGALGAAAATARLLRLDAERSAMALSLATSTAGGFMSQFGTMAKPLHAGNAAKGGILSACFAQDGMTAGWHTLDGPTGMNTLMVGPDREELRAAIREPEHGQTLTFETESIGEPLLIIENKFRVKRFPTCGSAHRSLDAMLALLEEHGFRAEDIERIDVHAPAMHLKNLMYERPETGLQGKFSVEYPLACVIIKGECILDDFTDEALARPAYRALFERIHRHPNDLPETGFSTTIKVTLKDGRVVEKSVSMPLGSKVAPFPTELYWKKFDQCTTGVMSSADQKNLKQALEDFTSLARAGKMTRCMGVELKPTGYS